MEDLPYVYNEILTIRGKNLDLRKLKIADLVEIFKMAELDCDATDRLIFKTHWGELHAMVEMDATGSWIDLQVFQLHLVLLPEFWVTLEDLKKIYGNIPTFFNYLFRFEDGREVTQTYYLFNRNLMAVYCPEEDRVVGLEYIVPELLESDEDEDQDFIEKVLEAIESLRFQTVVQLATPQ